MTDGPGFAGLSLAMEVGLGTVVPAPSNIAELFAMILDPSKRRALAGAIEAHLLHEVAHLHRLLHERAAQIEAGRCTPEEVMIITYQVIEDQRRTLDQEKRRRLTNVLVNGLCDAEWSKMEHRLLLRCAAELEGEHVVALSRMLPASPGSAHQSRERLSQEEQRRRTLEWWAVGDALRHELAARGLMRETLSAKTSRGPGPRSEDPLPVVETKTKFSISPLGRRFMDYLRDADAQPAAAVNEDERPPPAP